MPSCEVSAYCAEGTDSGGWALKRRALVWGVAILVAVAIAVTIGAVAWRSADGHGADTPHARPATEEPTASGPRPSPTPPPRPQPSPDAHAAEQVAREALSVAFRWYPGEDSFPSDGFARARRWFTDSAAARLLTDARTVRGPGIRWELAAAEGATVIAEVQIGCSGCPPDTDTLIHRVATVRQTVITDHPDGQGQRAEQFDQDTVVWLTLVKIGDQWLIDNLRY